MTGRPRPDEAALAAAGLDEKDAVRADITATRDELASTVDALSDKLDVKARAGHRVHQLSAKAAPHRGKILAGTALTLLALVVARRRRAAQRRMLER